MKDISDEEEVDVAPDNLEVFCQAVESGIAQFYSLKQSEALFLVQGWDGKKGRPSVCM